MSMIIFGKDGIDIPFHKKLNTCCETYVHQAFGVAAEIV